MRHISRDTFTRPLRVAVCWAVLAATLAAAPAAQASINFQFDYGASSGTGFWDPVYGTQRREALQSAANSFSTMFASHFTNSGTILLSAASSTSTSSGYLAYAGSYIFNTGTPGFQPNSVPTALTLSGTNIFGPGQSMGTVGVNFGYSWQLNGNAPVSSTQYDFVSTVYHELTHIIGFSAAFRDSGAPYFGTTSNGQWGPFGRFLADKNGANVINLVSGQYTLDQAKWDAIKAGGGTLFFNGPNAMAANGGKLVPLYSPNPYAQGSSISHLDEGSLGWMLMSPFAGRGQGARDYSDIEVGMLQDLGYTPTPIPGAVLLLGSGLGVLVGIRSRRRGK